MPRWKRFPTEARTQDHRYVGDQPGAAWDLDAYRQQIDSLPRFGGTTNIFQSCGLTQQTDDEIAARYQAIGQHAGQFYGFEHGDMFAPAGKIDSLQVYEGLLGIPACRGGKHSSLPRLLEWQRLERRDRIRSEFPFSMAG